LWGLNKLKSGYFTSFLALYNTTQNLYIYRMLNKTNTKQGESMKAYSKLNISIEKCVNNWNKLHNALNNIWQKPVVDKSGFTINNSNICMSLKAEGKPYKYQNYQHIVDCEDWNYNLIFEVITKIFPKANVWTDGFRIHIEYKERA